MWLQIFFQPSHLFFCFQLKLLGCDRVVKKSNMSGARFLVNLFSIYDKYTKTQTLLTIKTYLCVDRTISYSTSCAFKNLTGLLQLMAKIMFGNGNGNPTCTLKKIPLFWWKIKQTFIEHCITTMLRQAKSQYRTNNSCFYLV